MGDTAPIHQRPHRILYSWWEVQRVNYTRCWLRTPFSHRPAPGPHQLPLMPRRMAKCNIVWITTWWTRWPNVKHTQCLEQWRSLRRWGMPQSVISSLNLTKGYWQIPIAPDSLEKTVLKTPFRLYEFKVMPLVCIICLQHSRGPPCWHLLCGCQKFAQAYLDDITVFSLNWQEHLQHLQEMLVQNQLAGFKV